MHTCSRESSVRGVAGATATVPRMYHSIASLVASGAVITAGSNPQGSYLFQSDPATGVYPAELRIEYYYPWCAPRSSVLYSCLGSLSHVCVRQAGLGGQNSADYSRQVSHLAAESLSHRACMDMRPGA